MDLLLELLQHTHTDTLDQKVFKEIENNELCFNRVKYLLFQETSIKKKNALHT